MRAGVQARMMNFSKSRTVQIFRYILCAEKKVVENFKLMRKQSFVTNHTTRINSNVATPEARLQQMCSLTYFSVKLLTRKSINKRAQSSEHLSASD